MGTYGNIKKMIDEGMPSWNSVLERGLSSIRTSPGIGKFLSAEDGHEFINMVSCSYLALNRHPAVVEGAIQALRDEGTMTVSVSRTRIAPALLYKVEDQLSDLFQAKAMVALSCSAASAGVLPVLSSGCFTDGVKPYMLFDKNAHFSMHVMKAACGDETAVETCPHNDVNSIEDMCKKNSSVAYITDAAFSMGGHAPLKDLQFLQDKYGLFLYLDDSHSISIIGDKGVGLARSSYSGSLHPRTIIVASLAKAFGATGGLILMGDKHQYEVLSYMGGPLNWSQMVNPAGLGAIRASATIHSTSELKSLQNKLYENLKLFDDSIHSENANSNLPIRVINTQSKEDAINVASSMYENGFYCSPVFFPIVARNKSGIRLMCRSDLDTNDLHKLSSCLTAAKEAAHVSAA